MLTFEEEKNDKLTYTTFGAAFNKELAKQLF